MTGDCNVCLSFVVLNSYSKFIVKTDAFMNDHCNVHIIKIKITVLLLGCFKMLFLLDLCKTPFALYKLALHYYNSVSQTCTKQVLHIKLFN